MSRHAPALTRQLERAVLALGVVAFCLVAAVALFAPQLAAAQMEHKVGTGTVGIENEVEHRLFYSLICTCGCPRETLGTCVCDFAHERRAELRRFLSEGKTVPEIQDLYLARFGPAVLAVPKSRATFLVPLALISLGTGGAIALLRRWRRPLDVPAPKKSTKKKARDAYDDQLDDELRRMDE